MNHGLIIAPVAGLIAALMFASTASGAVLAGFLVFLAPLPIMGATMGWGSAVGLAAALLGACSLGAVIGPLTFVAFLIAIGLPAWWLARLAITAQPAPAQRSRRRRAGIRPGISSPGSSRLLSSAAPFP